MCRTSPQLPSPFSVPVLPKVDPHLWKIVLLTKVIDFLNCPSFDCYRLWCCIPWYHWMGTVMSFHHTDDGFAILCRTKSTPTILLFILFLTNISVCLF